jgi:hypothetical protein
LPSEQFSIFGTNSLSHKAELTVLCAFKRKKSVKKISSQFLVSRLT